MIGFARIAKVESPYEELRRTKLALWIARALNGYNTTHNETSYHNYMIEHPNTNVSMRRWFSCWNLVERKCIKKANEYK